MSANPVVDRQDPLLVDLIASVRVLEERQTAFDRKVDGLFKAERELNEAFRTEDQKAIAKAEVAAEAARVALHAEAEGWKKDHNNLIDRLTELTQDHSRSLGTLVSKEQLGQTVETITTRIENVQLNVDRTVAWQNKMTGGIVLAAAIGIVNFVKVWTG